MALPLIHALRRRTFLLLWSGQTASRLGDSMHRFALVWWVLKKTDSGLAMGTVVACQTLPMLGFLLVGGVTVDRWSRAHIMLWSDVSRGVLTSAIAVLAFTGQLELWHVYIAAVVFGFVEAFFQPAYTALVPAVVPTEDLPSANSLSLLGTQLANIVGPSIGAAIVAVGGTSLAFAIDAGSFVISASCLVPLLSIPRPQPNEHGGSMLSEMRQGFRVVLADPWLRTAIAIFAMFNAADYGAFAITLPLLITRTMQLGPGPLGVVQSTFAIGTVVAAIWTGRRGRLHRRGIVMYGCLALAGACMLALGASITIVGIGAVLFVRGLVLSIASLVWTNTLQEVVPSHELGRVSSIDWLGSGGLMPVGFALVGWSTDHASPSLVFAIVGIMGVGLALLALHSRRVRLFD